MSRKFLVPIDLNQLELQNAVIQKLATAPGSPVSGQIYYDTAKGAAFYYNGSSWINMGGSVARDTFSNRPSASAANANTLFFATDRNLLYVSDGSAWAQVSAFGSGASTSLTIAGTSADGSSNSYARADHTHAGPGFGNPSSLSFGGASAPGVATTVSRSDHEHAMPAHDAAAHSAIKISDLAAPSADVSWGTSYKITNLADPTSAQHAATKNYVDTRKVTDLTAPTSDFSMNSHKITNLLDPVNAQDAATKGYVDGAIAGLDWKTSVNLLADTNVNLSAPSGTLVIDGHTALDNTDNGYRILLTGQTTAADNGIYVYSDDLALYTLTRAEDANQYQELINASVFVSEGTTYGKTSWVQANHYLTSFSGQEWVQFSGQGTYVAGNGIAFNGNIVNFNPTLDGGLNASASGAFVKLPLNSGLSTSLSGLAVGAGTGITVSTSMVSIDTSVVARKYSVAVGSAGITSYTVTHNLGTRDVTVQVRETGSPYAKVEPDIVMSTVNTVTISFAVAPTTDQYTVTVIG